MRISIGSDHRGTSLRSKLIPLLRGLGHEVEDEGTDSTGSVDYPDIAAAVAGKVANGQAERGVLICGTGIGMAIAANKFCGVRAAAVHDEVTAEMSRRHNNVNVLCLSGDMMGERPVDRMVEIWLNTEFEGGRHERRVNKIAALERGELACGQGS